MTEKGQHVSQRKPAEGEQGVEPASKLGTTFGIPFQTLLSREVRRFTRVWTQTLLAPLFTSALYVVVFGYGLGSRIREVEGIPYLEFILPGLILLSVVTGSYGNTSSSIFDAKRERYIDDVLISPMTPLQMAFHSSSLSHGPPTTLASGKQTLPLLTIVQVKPSPHMSSQTMVQKRPASVVRQMKSLAQSSCTTQASP